MDLVRLQTPHGPLWTADERTLAPEFSLAALLALPAWQQPGYIDSNLTGGQATGTALAPVEAAHEVWASGVTYLRSREAREAESATGDIYQRVYQAARPELFFKANGWRVVGPGAAIRVRADSKWNVPEPELVLVINRQGEICGYSAGNDVSSRDIEGENPLYLPQAKVYNGSCALGPAIRLIETPGELTDLPIRLEIWRAGQSAFSGQTSTGMMKRGFQELVEALYRELDFPQGAFLFTGTGIVPPETFSLQPGDEVEVQIGELSLRNPTA